MATVKGGPYDWTSTRSADGNREYKCKVRVKAATGEGPAAVRAAVDAKHGLGTAWGSTFDAGGGGWNCTDSDPWAFRRLTDEVGPDPKAEKENFVWYEVGLTYTTKNDSGRCRDQQIDDPLLEPQKVSGSFVKYTEQCTTDRYGCLLINSAFEQLRGPEVEFDFNRPTVRVEQNVAALDLALLAFCVDKVNAQPMWGLPARTIKLSSCSWEKKFYGTCSAYYTRSFEFDIRYDTFDRDVMDMGTKVLAGKWGSGVNGGNWIVDSIAGAPANPLNPRHFVRFKDRNGENAPVILNGHGLPADVTIGSGTFAQRPDTGTGLANPACTTKLTYTNAGNIHIERYGDVDFFLLGVPATL